MHYVYALYFVTYSLVSAIAARKAADKWIISPLTGERIPADKLQEHMRYNTVDSQYKEQRERFKQTFCKIDFLYIKNILFVNHRFF